MTRFIFMRVFAGLAFVAATVSTLETTAQTVGRLFSTPMERELLDELRNAPPPVAPAPAPVVEAPPEPVLVREPEPPEVQNVRIDGLVLRSDGRNVIWVNGSAVQSGASTYDGVRVEAKRAAGGSVRVVHAEGSSAAELRPGESVEFVGGQIVSGIGSPERVESSEQ